MSDTDRLLDLLQAASDTGVHTSELRYHGVSGNPSQRRADLEERGYTISSTPEPYPSDPRRCGARYRLVAAPEFSTPCTPASGRQPPVQAPALATAPLPGPGQASLAARCAIDDDLDFDQAA